MQVFFCKFCNILKNTSFVKHIGTAAAKKISDTAICKSDFRWVILGAKSSPSMKKTAGKIINRLSLHRNQRWPRKIRCEMQLEWLEKWNNSLTIHFKLQKQPSRGVLRKRCSENMQQIYRRTPFRSAISIKLLYNFIEIGLQHGCSPVNLLHIFRTSFPSNTLGRLLLTLETAYNFFVSWRNFHW